MPQVEVIEVSEWLIEHTPELRIQLGGTQIPCRSGKQLGSLCAGCSVTTLDYLPQEMLVRVSNVADFARVSSPRQVDVQRRWAASCVLPEKATESEVYRIVC